MRKNDFAPQPFSVPPQLIIAMQLLSKTILFCLAALPVFAQTKKEPSMQDFQREMLDMHRRLFEQFNHISPENPGFSMPEWKWDTTLSFKIDTFYGDQGTGFSQRFFLSPFGRDSNFLNDFFGANPFPGGTTPFGEPFQWSFPPGSGFPENEENSALDDPGDGLLPEERLRKESETGTTTPEKSIAPEPKKPKIKTIRI